MPDVTFRPGVAADATLVADLHAESWRRHYRGAYSDSFLDGDVFEERRAYWTARFAAPAGTETVIAERDGAPAGFLHLVLDHDPTWGSLVDNLHVVPAQHRTGLGTRLLAHAAEAVLARAGTPALYLWVLEQNVAAQAFYRARGGRHAETAALSPKGGDPSRLVGAPRKFRMVWPDATVLTDRHV